MYHIKHRISTPKGDLAGGSVVGQKDLDKHLSKKEQKEMKDAGLIVSVIPEDVALVDDKEEKTLEELVDTEDKNDLKVSELDTVLDHYKLEKTGNKAEKVARINAFEEALDGDLSELDDEMLQSVAIYCEVDTSLDRDEMITAIEAALEE